MKGKVIILVGATGEGKTTYTTTKFKTDRQTICYLRLESDIEGKNLIKFTNFMEFLNFSKRKKNKKFIIDEAYSCLPKTLNIKMDNPDHPHNMLIDFLLNARKLNNFILIPLHSCKQIPEWLPTYADYVIRFNTNDQFNYQAQRFISFPTFEQSLRNEPHIKEKMLLAGRKITKPKILKLR
jgi:hypothetical protein